MATYPLFNFDKKHLEALAEKNAKQYQDAEPVPHIYFDNFLPDEVAERVLEEFPGPEDIEWKHYTRAEELKLACEDPEKIPPYIRHILDQFNSGIFLSFLEKLTGIEGLIADPHFRGGGMHQIKRGGYLKIHVDFNWYSRWQVNRRLNVLFFLNKNWKDEYGGHFELWDKKMEKKIVSIAPEFNRLAIFSTSEESFHGHPDPLATPKGITRKSLALYYYTSSGGDNKSPSHKHTTIFKERSGTDSLKSNITAKDAIKLLIPPLFINVFKMIKNKIREKRR